jgi:type I restriction enzyme R subunit
MAFADRLEQALKVRGIEPLIDRSEIYAFEDWWKRIEVLIARADTVVFVLSPDAVSSDVCRKEVAFAASLNKRFAPIVCRRVDDHDVPAALARINFVSFEDDALFERSADRLAEALDTDIAWVRQHTDFGEQARRWALAGRPDGLLLRSPALEQAERWIAARPRGAPAPTDETQAYVAQGRLAATRRRNALSGSLAAGLVLALGLAAVAFWQRGVAVEQRGIAERNEAIAKDERDRATRNFKLAQTTAESLVFDIGTDGGIHPRTRTVEANPGGIAPRRVARIRFTYATNGRGVYGIDMETGKEGELPHYPTPGELWKMTFSEPNVWRDRFAAVPFEDKGGFFLPRYYQDIAIERVMEAIAADQPRILLTLATGTGKTFIAFQIAWKLFHSRWNLSREPVRRPRILFLADRNILADQAYNAFSAFPEDAMVRIAPEDIRKKGKVPKNGSLFFTIFQTFMSGPPKDGKPSPYFGEYPPDFFDFIVIDECHRGGANDESNWREIMDYFAPAVQLGLTATPKRKDNVDTYAYFREPVYIYSLKEGINDGFLTPFKVKQISTTLDDYVYTPDDTVVEGEIEQGKRYDEPDFNKIIEIKEREKKRVEIFMEQIDQNEKTLVFCANQAHALVVRDLVNQLKTSKDPNYCQRVTADDGKLGEQHLRDFQDNEKLIPTILTTSQKLSTGVDARNIRNIVLMRPINSMIEFKQIIGRGTRLYDGKDYFTIYDFVRAHHHFNDPEWDGEPSEPEEHIRVRRFIDPNELPTPPVTENDQSEYGKRQKIKVKLADGKDRSIQHMMATTFWHPDGMPMSAQQFLEMLFGKLPEFFKDEDELRTLWSAPDTRAKLLQGLAEKGFGKDQLAEMQRIIDAHEPLKSSLYVPDSEINKLVKGRQISVNDWHTFHNTERWMELSVKALGFPQAENRAP